jgi:hypothetical protein
MTFIYSSFRPHAYNGFNASRVLGSAVRWAPSPPARTWVWTRFHLGVMWAVVVQQRRAVRMKPYTRVIWHRSKHERCAASMLECGVVTDTLRRSWGKLRSLKRTNLSGSYGDGSASVRLHAWYAPRLETRDRSGNIVKMLGAFHPTRCTHTRRGQDDTAGAVSAYLCLPGARIVIARGDGCRVYTIPHRLRVVVRPSGAERHRPRV